MADVAARACRSRRFYVQNDGRSVRPTRGNGGSRRSVPRPRHRADPIGLPLTKTLLFIMGIGRNLAEVRPQHTHPRTDAGSQPISSPTPYRGTRSGAARLPARGMGAGATRGAGTQSGPGDRGWGTARGAPEGEGAAPPDAAAWGRRLTMRTGQGWTHRKDKRPLDGVSGSGSWPGGGKRNEAAHCHPSHGRARRRRGGGNGPAVNPLVRKERGRRGRLSENRGRSPATRQAQLRASDRPLRSGFMESSAVAHRAAPVSKCPSDTRGGPLPPCRRATDHLMSCAPRNGLRATSRPMTTRPRSRAAWLRVGV